MNLHVFPDDKFVDDFIEDLDRYGLRNNTFVIVTGRSKPKYISKSIDKVKIVKSPFDIKETKFFDEVFLHSFPNLLNKWVLANSFKSLNWIVWGYDFYNNPFNNYPLYSDFSSRAIQVGRVTGRGLKGLIGKLFRALAVNKIDRVLTWMDFEYELIKKSLWRKPAFEFFFYGQNLIDYSISFEFENINRKPRILVGNSGHPLLNHIDVFELLRNTDCEIICPVSYGKGEYINYLKEHYSNVFFITDYLDKQEYIDLLKSCDIAVINSTRPSGVGNIALLLQLGKPLVLNEINPLKIYLTKKGASLYDLSDLNDINNIIVSNNPANNLAVYKSILNKATKEAVFKRLFS